VEVLVVDDFLGFLVGFVLIVITICLAICLIALTVNVVWTVF
jgi:hypothetical protein